MGYSITRNKWWGYVHVNGTYHVKRFFTKESFNDVKTSPFVLHIVDPFEAYNRDSAIEKFKENLPDTVDYNSQINKNDE